MFKITSKQAISWEWASFSLNKGANDFLSRAAIPAALWPKLERFRALGILDFEGKAEAGKPEAIKLAELSEAQLYDLDKDQLAELAKASSVSVSAGAKKKDLLDALVAKLPKPATEEKPEAPAPSKSARPAVSVES